LFGSIPLSIDFFKARGGIALSAHPCAAGSEFGSATHFKTGDNTSAVTHHKTGGVLLMLRARMEIVVLKYKPASQETHCLVYDCLPGAYTLTRMDFALVINIKTLFI
jgi:hypothetical protein